MMSVKIEARGDGVYPYTYFKCPHCGMEDKFFSISPVECLNCCVALPDIRRLIVEPSYRRDYHRGI